MVISLFGKSFLNPRYSSLETPFPLFDVPKVLFIPLCKLLGNLTIFGELDIIPPIILDYFRESGMCHPSRLKFEIRRVVCFCITIEMNLNRRMV